MAIIIHMIGICFYAALAASGYLVATQTLYWIGLFFMFAFSSLNYYNCSVAVAGLKVDIPISKEMSTMIDLSAKVDLDSRTVHVLFANIIHATIAFHLLHAPVLAVAILISAACTIISIQKFKELLKCLK